MKIYEDAWSAEDKQRHDNYEKNKACFEQLPDSAKLEILWEEYVEKNVNNPGLHKVLSSRYLEKDEEHER